MRNQIMSKGIARFSIELPLDLGERLARAVHASGGKETKISIIRRAIAKELDTLERPSPTTETA